MKYFIKRDLLLYKALMPFVIFVLIILSIFLFVMYNNNWNTTNLFLQMCGSITSDLNYLSISILFIVNSSILAYTLYILIHDYQKAEVFLRIKSIKKWLINKMISLIIINIINIVLLLSIFVIITMILNKDITGINITILFEILFTKYLFQLLIILFYTYTKYLSIIINILIIILPIYIKATAFTYVDYYQIIGGNIEKVIVLLLFCLTIVFIVINNNRFFEIKEEI